MTAAPDTTVFGQSLEAWFVVLVLLLSVLLISVVLTRALIEAGRLPPPTALVTALSVLTLFAMASGLAGRGDQPWTIAAAGVGALAGSVTTVFSARRTDKPPEPPEPSEDVLERSGAIAEPETPAEVVYDDEIEFGEPGLPPEPTTDWDEQR